MRTHSLFAALFVIVTAPLMAQEDTATQRAVYETTNKKLGTYKVTDATLKDDELEWSLKFWKDGSEVRKILAKVPGEDGDGFEEYYLDGGKLVFAFRTYTQGDGKKIEDRFYFKGGKLVKWLDTAKKPVPSGDESFTSESARLTGNCAKFVQAAGGKSGATEKPAKAGALQSTSGTFTGIEQGDYFHWNMTTDAGEEVSYFLLKTDEALDKVIEKPEAYKGRKCTVKWKETTEDIPEAGGKIKVQQVVSVEWAAKK